MQRPPPERRRWPLVNATALHEVPAEGASRDGGSCDPSRRLCPAHCLLYLQLRAVDLSVVKGRASVNSPYALVVVDGSLCRLCQ